MSASTIENKTGAQWLADRFDLDANAAQHDPRIARLVESIDALVEPPPARKPAGRWNPWRGLRARPDVLLAWEDLDDDLLGTVGELEGGGFVITLDPRLDRVTRRCVLAHELIHVERGITWGVAGTMEREEVIVDLETARRLVPPAELEELIEQRESLGKGVEARHIAKEFDVTEEVAHDAAKVLRRTRRGVPLPAFAEAWEASR